ncbi:uncharacterized protein KY384_004122 [Bacidia gigantensis]|uniref:uncharacterized protein n=1 Tax=Bacidia gigantensis TaxID=2732470 RepID=UPI001D036E72|nr:uncharacterized protein KY384_004122 [Bacidia gigantensis]KAG8530765.1 hypothetical protein KY384_004122 [Bacidia gigantensis]
MSRPTTPTPPLPTMTTSDNHSFTSPSRSSTLPQKPANPSKHHIHHHPHRSHHTHRYNKSVPQSAIERSTPYPFGELLRGEWRRRGSIENPADSSTSRLVPENAVLDIDANALYVQDQKRLKAKAEQAEKERLRKVAAEVGRLRRGRQEHEESLRLTLSHLSDLGTTMTRRLDYTYYALLTSLSGLTNGVKAFHALARESGGMHEGFVAEAQTLEKETGGQIKGAIEGLDRQAQRVDALQRRMGGAKGRMADLENRLQRVRTKAEEAGRREKEGRARLGRRWKVCSYCVGTWVMVLGIALLVRKIRLLEIPDDVNVYPNGSNTLDWGNDTTRSQIEGGVVTELMASAVEGAYAAVTCDAEPVGAEEQSSMVDAEATLRLFDEL